MTGDPIYDLLAHVYKLALKDAKQGRADAIEFLDATLPDWQGRVLTTVCTSNMVDRQCKRGIAKSVAQ